MLNKDELEYLADAVKWNRLHSYRRDLGKDIKWLDDLEQKLRKMEREFETRKEVITDETR